jgi:hypothetical protein
MRQCGPRKPWTADEPPKAASNDTSAGFGPDFANSSRFYCAPFQRRSAASNRRRQAAPAPCARELSPNLIRRQAPHPSLDETTAITSPPNQPRLCRSGQAAGLTPARHPSGDGPVLPRRRHHLPTGRQPSHRHPPMPTRKASPTGLRAPTRHTGSLTAPSRQQSGEAGEQTPPVIVEVARGTPSVHSGADESAFNERWQEVLNRPPPPSGRSVCCTGPYMELQVPLIIFSFFLPQILQDNDNRDSHYATNYGTVAQ